MSALSPTWILRSTVATVLALLVGIAVVVGVAFLVAKEAPDGVRDLRAYKAAERCPTAPSAPAECRWTQEFTVSGTHLTHKRSESNRALLTDAAGGRWETRYPSHGPVLFRLDDGDKVTGTIWRGRLTEIASEGDSQETYAAPDNMRAGVLILALITVPPGLLMTAACAWRLRRHGAPAPTPGMVATLGLAFGLFVAGPFSPLVLGDRDKNFWIVAAAWLPMAATLTFVARIYVTRKRSPDTAAG
ncbi:hypothetical protein CDO52_00400 [Nocardiopsis gilva YIM 90087]|uniref:Uncharacterized protein n=1 Tax=Nocardiopsis gilva YIM 90087 TaxID=1235441 RepID=A0A223S084_9ACTN|nr:hypothetical protein [Nocardiopsis gilva]ASU81439.1 hypothetical protein CDO52_00400 [Nocardiopsis gilva YIM 90087]